MVKTQIYKDLKSCSSQAILLHHVQQLLPIAKPKLVSLRSATRFGDLVCLSRYSDGELVLGPLAFKTLYHSLVCEDRRVSYGFSDSIHISKAEITSEVVDGSLALSEDYTLSIKLRTTLVILVNNRDN